MSATNPEQRIRAVLVQGVAAVSANLSLLDSILEDLSANDLASVKAFWADHPPTVLSGYARSEGPFPCIAITLVSEEITQDYIGVGQEARFLGSPAVKNGTQYKRRVTGTYGVMIYAEHPDIVSCYYRVARRILNVGVWRMLEGGLNEAIFSGADLMPDAKYAPDNLFVRRINVTTEYEETWTDTDALALALQTTIEQYLSSSGRLDLFHVDSGGGVTPY